MTIMLILLAAAALFAAIHRTAPPLALDEDWEQGLPPRLEDLELLLSPDEGNDGGWGLWRTDFNQKKVFF